MTSLSAPLSCSEQIFCLRIKCLSNPAIDDVCRDTVHKSRHCATGDNCGEAAAEAEHFSQWRALLRPQLRRPHLRTAISNLLWADGQKRRGQDDSARLVTPGDQAERRRSLRELTGRSGPSSNDALRIRPSQNSTE